MTERFSPVDNIEEIFESSVGNMEGITKTGNGVFDTSRID